MPENDLSKREKDKISDSNNEQVVREGAKIAEISGEPHAVVVGKAITKADKLTGGKSTKVLGKAATSYLKKSSSGRRTQRFINRIGNNSIASSNQENVDLQDEVDDKLDAELRFPIKLKTFITILIIFLPILLLLFFVVLSDKDEGNSSSASGSLFSGVSRCSKIVVENTDCDENGENCTNKYDGEILFEDYIAGVIAGEFGDSANNLEYYKAMSVAVRTYFMANYNNSTCTISGTEDGLNYMDVSDSRASLLIKQAVDETKGLVFAAENEEISASYYSKGCVVNKDSDFYIRYGSQTLEEFGIQKIPVEWDNNESAYKDELTKIYNNSNSNGVDYNVKECPVNTDDYGMSTIGALYLITKNNYTYEDVIKYYYGEYYEIMSIYKLTSGNADGYINPTEEIVCSSPFGPREFNGEIEEHSGIDIAINEGSPVYAVKDGIVSNIEKDVTAINDCDYSYGNFVMIQHDDGTATIYAHMRYSSIPDTLNIGDTVSQGDEIGLVGSTGCSTGYHLHYEVRVNNIAVDPIDYLDLSEATGECQR